MATQQVCFIFFVTIIKIHFTLCLEGLHHLNNFNGNHNIFKSTILSISHNLVDLHNRNLKAPTYILDL